MLARDDNGGGNGHKKEKYCNDIKRMLEEEVELNISLFSLCGNENIARAQETKGQMKKKSQMNGGGTSADGNEAGRWEVNASVLLSCHASLAPGVRRSTIGLFHPPEKSCQRFHRYVSYISLKLMFRVPLYRQRGPSGHIFWRLLSTATTIGPNLV